MTDILITGFTPFDGREINSSWTAARLTSEAMGNIDLDILEIPAVWGMPMQILQPLFESNCPETVIAMGEGRDGWFDIETLAHNRRKARSDNLGKLPDLPLIHTKGVSQINSTFDSTGLQHLLQTLHFPVHLSRDAGGFLCEEMLYSLEILKEKHSRLKNVVFVHLPPFGSQVFYKGRCTSCNDRLLGLFGTSLLKSVLKLTGGR